MYLYRKICCVVLFARQQKPYHEYAKCEQWHFRLYSRAERFQVVFYFQCTAAAAAAPFIWYYCLIGFGSPPLLFNRHLTESALYSVMCVHLSIESNWILTTRKCFSPETRTKMNIYCVWNMECIDIYCCYTTQTHSTVLMLIDYVTMACVIWLYW